MAQYGTRTIALKAEQEADTIAKQLSDFVNRYSQPELEYLANELLRDHRTLIQGKARFVHLFIKLLSESEYDLRNQGSVQWAKSVIANCDKDAHFPLI